MGSIPPPTFQGQSHFASDFQQVLIRAVAIAELPLRNMQNQLQTLTAQQSALTALSSTFGALQTAITNIGSAATSLSATSSDPSSVTATAASNALPATYTVQVTTLGSSTTTISSAGSPAVSDPTTGNISSASSFTLTVNGVNKTITPSGTSLNDLAAAINSAGANVQATVVNVGSNSSPDYRLSITSDHLAPDTVQLNDGTNNLLTTLSTGAATAYKVDGVSTTTDSSQVTLAPGLTVNLLQQSASPVSITVAQDTSSLSNSLSGFVTAYNNAVDALAQQHGQNAGVLAGQSTVLTLGQALSTINSYSSSGSNPLSLASLGLTLDTTTGHLSLDSTALNSLDAATIQQFLGSIGSGGFLDAANNAMKALTDPTSGVIQTSLTGVQTDITNENNLIAQEQDRITQIQNNLQTQLSAADATLSVLESQVSFMTNLLTTSNANNFVGH